MSNLRHLKREQNIKFAGGGGRRRVAITTRKRGNNFFHSNRATFLSFSVALLLLAQAPNLLLAANSNTTTSLTISPSLTTTTTVTAPGNSNETTTNAPAVKTTTTTTTTTLSPESSNQDDPEPLTSTVESISVNIDETSTTVVDTLIENSTDVVADDVETAIGIEPKSISRDSGDSNSYADEDANSDNKANLSIDPSTGKASGEGLDHADRQSTSSPSVNMTQIDQIYTDGHRDAKASAESWHRMGKKMKKGIGNIIGSIVPMALNMTQEARISSNCSGAMLKWVLSMNQLKSWALRMLDASGKPIAGLLEGSVTMFGNYRQCLKIRAPDDDEIEFTGSFKEYFRGKYCVIQAKPWLPEKSRFYNLNTKLEALMRKSSDDESYDESTDSQFYDKTVFDELSEWALAFNFINIRYDLCIPSLCKREDIQKAVNYLLKNIDLKARVLRCETDAIDSSPFFSAATVETGSLEVAEALVAATNTQSHPGTTSTYLFGDMQSFSQLGWILIPLIAIVLVLIATALSLTISKRDTDGDTVPLSNPKAGSKIGHTINSLSLRRSISSHLNIDYDQLADDKPLALYGVRFMLVLWVILVESAVNLKFEYLRELMMLKDLIFWWPLQFIINSTLQYDSLILLTAFTMGYKNVLNEGMNQGKAITRFVVDKFVRLMPSTMVMVALVILMPLVYRGPVWNDYVTSQSAVCQSTGWLNLIFLQNYLPYEQICLPQTWLLCVEFQLVLLMAPLVYYLNKGYTKSFGSSQQDLVSSNGSSGKGTHSSCKHDSSKMFFWFWTTPGLILVTCILASSSVSFYNVYYRELPPSWFYTMADPDSKALYFGEHMTKLWTHLAVFAIGLLAGVECRRAAKNVLCSYRCSNMDYISHDNSFLRQHKNHTSASVTSLPVIFETSQKNGINSTGKPGGGDLMGNWHSSISINMSNNSATSNAGHGSHENLNGLHPRLTSDDHEKARSRGLLSILSNIFISLIAITTMSLIIFSTHDWSLNDLPRPYVAGLFDAGSRFFWSLAMIWLLYMISVPNKDRSFSILARALGHPLMVCLGKLSFLIYIIHPFIHTAVLAIQEQPIYSSWLMLFHILIGNITITVILASLVSLFVEMPCRNLFRRCGTSLLLTQSDIITGSTTDNHATTATTNAATTPTASSSGGT